MAKYSSSHITKVEDHNPGSSLGTSKEMEIRRALLESICLALHRGKSVISSDFAEALVSLKVDGILRSGRTLVSAFERLEEKKNRQGGLESSKELGLRELGIHLCGTEASTLGSDTHHRATGFSSYTDFLEQLGAVCIEIIKSPANKIASSTFRERVANLMRMAHPSDSKNYALARFDKALNTRLPGLIS